MDLARGLVHTSNTQSWRQIAIAMYLAIIGYAYSKSQKSFFLTFSKAANPEKVTKI